MRKMQSLSIISLSELRQINSFFQYDHSDNYECLCDAGPLLSLK